MRTHLTVLKIGGSVLTGLSAFHRSAELLTEELAQDSDWRFLVVVSAEAGATDALEQLACEIAPTPDSRTLDLLWSIGERKSAALLALCLHRAGLNAVALDFHQIGLRAKRVRTGEVVTTLATSRIRRELRRHQVVVIPGFFGLDSEGHLVSLGRGGSDLTAVLLACELGAARCELVKDVPGFFTADPNRDPDAKPIAEMSYDRALSMARAGCDLVQLKALEVAASRDLTLVVRALGRGTPSTRVGNSWSAMDRIRPAPLKAIGDAAAI